MGIILMASTPQKIVPNRYHVVPRTLFFIFCHDQVLLLKGAKNKKINAGLWNGLGGHIERGEDIISSARRELKEEAGIWLEKPNLCGTIMIDVSNDEGILLFVFAGNVEDTSFVNSMEGDLHWFSVNSLPNENIVDDVEPLIPRVLQSLSTGKQFHLLYSYDSLGNRITTYSE